MKDSDFGPGILLKGLVEVIAFRRRHTVNASISAAIPCLKSGVETDIKVVKEGKECGTSIA